MSVCSLANKPMVRYLLVVLMVMVTMIVEPMAGNINISGQREQEIELRLKQLNKQAVKSIENPNGEIIDCIPIAKQPAFDHPMLKNHTIQMTPSSYPHEVLTKEDNAPTPSNDQEQPENISQPWQFAGECPENTIPIKRTTKEDLLRVDDINNYGKKSNISQPHYFYHPTDIAGDNYDHEYAITYVQHGPYYGTKAHINVWKPRTEVGETSISQTWIYGGHFGPSMSLNTIEAGTHVNPTLYGDANPHFFIYWTSDNYQKTGCYNLMCSGFIQINRRVSPGGVFKHISTYNGPQFIFTIKIWKDSKTGNWWLELNGKDLVGYWPKELLPNLAHGTDTIEWGGEVVSKKNKRQHTTTEMGSGHFPSEGFRKASNFKAVKVIDMNNGIIDPGTVHPLVSRPTCYNLKYGHSKNWEFFFYYGGPGRNPKCP